MNSIYRAGVNPALCLYQFWHLILTSRTSDGNLVPEDPANRERLERFHDASRLALYYHGVRSGYGPHHHGIAVAGVDINDQPVFTYGRVWRSGGMDTRFVVAADGRFSAFSPFGDAQRRSLSEGTFLNYGWQSSRWRWFVDTHHTNSWRDLSDYQRQVPYIDEGFLQSGVWYCLEPHETGWRLVLAENQAAPGAEPSPDGERPRFKHFRTSLAYCEEMRDRRYRKLENRRRRDLNLPPLPKAITATLRDGKQTLDREQALDKIVALLDVSTPAKSTPLRREARKEAHL